MSDKSFLEDFAIGALIGWLLVKVPALRRVAAMVAIFFGVVWFMATFVNGFNIVCLIFALGCFGIAAMFIRWSRQPARAAQAAQNNYAAPQTPEAIARLMEGAVVGSGPAVGYTIQLATVEPGTIRANGNEVWADVDLILSNGSAQAATFHANAAADRFEWTAKS